MRIPASSLGMVAESDNSLGDSEYEHASALPQAYSY